MSWLWSHQHLQQLIPTLKQDKTCDPKGEFVVLYDRWATPPTDINAIGQWLYQKSFELYAVGYCPPDDVIVIMGRDMARHLFGKDFYNNRVEVRGNFEYDYNIPKKVVLPKLSKTLPMFAGTQIDMANSITILYLPWVQGWCFCSIPELNISLNLRLEDGQPKLKDQEATESSSGCHDALDVAAHVEPQPDHGHRTRKGRDDVGGAER